METLYSLPTLAPAASTPAAGRLHTAYALMEELANCRKSISNVLPKQPCETLLVLDGTTGVCTLIRDLACLVVQLREGSIHVPGLSAARQTCLHMD